MVALITSGVEKEEKMFGLLFIFPPLLSPFYPAEWPVFSCRSHCYGTPLTVNSAKSFSYENNIDLPECSENCNK
jgi:hypothetical protein